MRKTISAALAATMILWVPACNQQPAEDDTAATTAAASLAALNGTWKADPESVKFEGRPDEFQLQDGTWKCNTCIPPLTAAADGQFHPVADRPYYDSMAITAVDDRTVEFRRRKGDKEVSRNTLQLSEDGNTLTNKFWDATTPDSPPVEGTTTLKRAAAAPAGAHAVSGKWTPERIADYSEEALNVTFQVDGDTVSSSVQGQSYTAEIGGPAVPVQGDTANTMVAVAREGTNGLRETYTRDGKEVAVFTIVPNEDGTALSITNTDPRDGSKASWTARKQG